MRDLCLLRQEEIYAGRAEIFHGLLEAAVTAFSADISGTIADLNRGQDDFGRDGLINPRTCFNVPACREFPPNNY